MSDKSHVTMEQRVCVVCGKLFDTGAILLDRQLRARFDRQTVTGWGMCPEHQKLIDDGYVALVSTIPPRVGSTVRPEDADRTGRLAFLKRDVWERIFTVPLPAKGVAFVSDEVLDHLEKLQPPPEVEP